MTQEALAEAAGISPHYLSTIETGKRDPSVSVVLSIAKALGASPGELLGGVEGLGPAAVEAAKLFERLPEQAQAVVLSMMRLLAKPAKSKSRR